MDLGLFANDAQVGKTRRGDGDTVDKDLMSIHQGRYWDDAKGGWLDTGLVEAARKD